MNLCRHSIAQVEVPKAGNPLLGADLVGLQAVQELSCSKGS